MEKSNNVKNKVRNFGVLLFVISIIMIISGCISTFIISLKKDQKMTQARMVVVKDAFDDFNSSVSLYENERDILYTESLGNLYYDTLASNDEAFKNKLSNYESIVDVIIKNVGEMDKLCKDVYYPDSDINNKCKNYKIIYEQVANYFMEDVNLYNSAVKTFNEQQVSLGTGVSLLEYSTKKNYVDYNGDGVYEGKEVK